MSESIPAATVILLRDEPAFEVLMVERHADISFAGGGARSFLAGGSMPETAILRGETFATVSTTRRTKKSRRASPPSAKRSRRRAF